MPKKRPKSKKKPKARMEEEIEEALLAEETEQPRKRKKPSCQEPCAKARGVLGFLSTSKTRGSCSRAKAGSMRGFSQYQEAEKLLEGDALLQGTSWWGKMFYKLLPFAIVAGGILTIHGILALTRGGSSRTKQEAVEMYDQNAVSYRESIISVLEDITSNGYSEEKHGPLPADNLERASVKRYDDLSQLLGRDFRGEISTFLEMAPRNSGDFKIYRIGLDKKDINLTEADEEFLEKHPELNEYEVIIREIAEACISEQDQDYKKIAGACTIVIYNKGSLFTYAGFITSQAVLRLLQSPSEDAEILKEEFVREFRNVVINNTGSLRNCRIVRDTTYQYFERLNEFLSQRSMQ